VLDIGRRSLNVVGMRVGDQRSLIMEIVRQGEGHVDADKIRRPAKGKILRLSFPTVYRLPYPREVIFCPAYCKQLANVRGKSK